MSYREQIAAIPGVRGVTVQNWFGGQDPKDPRNFFPQFAVDAPTFFPIYRGEMQIVEASAPQGSGVVPEGMDAKLAAFMEEQTACVVGEKFMKKMGWQLGQTITIAGTIYPGDWPMTIRAVYRPRNKSFGEETVFFHWKYLYENSDHQARAGVFILDLTDPDRAAAISKESGRRVRELVRRDAHRNRARLPGRLREHARQRAFRAQGDRICGHLRDSFRRGEHDDHGRARADRGDRGDEDARLLRRHHFPSRAG